MYYKILGVISSVAASFSVTQVHCDGVGSMSIHYEYNPINSYETLDRFDCIAEGTELSSPLVFNPYTCKGKTDNQVNLADYNVEGTDGHFMIHSTMKVGGKSFNLKGFNLRVSCLFSNEYQITERSYKTKEEDQKVKFDSFEMSEDNFSLTIPNNENTIIANTKMTANFEAIGAAWDKLDAKIQFVPTECTVTDPAGTEFNILGGSAGSCGYTQLLTELLNNDSGRSWSLKYMAFVMAADGGTFTLTCTVSMCTEANRAEGGSCAAAYACDPSNAIQHNINCSQQVLDTLSSLIEISQEDPDTEKVRGCEAYPDKPNCFSYMLAWQMPSDTTTDLDLSKLYNMETPRDYIFSLSPSYDGDDMGYQRELEGWGFEQFVFPDGLETGTYGVRLRFYDDDWIEFYTLMYNNGQITCDTYDEERHPNKEETLVVEVEV